MKFTLPDEPLALVPLEVFCGVSGLQKSATYAAIKNGCMPEPLRLSPRCSRWRAGDIREYLRAPFAWVPSKAIDYRAPGVVA